MTTHITQEVTPVLHCIYVDPLANSSQIPVLLVFRPTRQLVILATSRGVNDELFVYYNKRYCLVHRNWNQHRALHATGSKLMVNTMPSVPLSSWIALGAPIPYRGEGVVWLVVRIHKIAKRFKGGGVLAVGQRMIRLLHEWGKNLWHLIIRKSLAEHLSSRNNHSSKIWEVWISQTMLEEKY